MRPTPRLRHVGGRFRKDGMGGYDTVTMTWLPDVRDHSVLHSPIAAPGPSAADYSGMNVASQFGQVYGMKHMHDPNGCQFCSFEIGESE
jgi:hypothetical protein